MSIRTVHLDDDAEATLAYIRQRSGLSISEVLKQGLKTYATSLKEEVAEAPIEIYRRLDLRSGGYAVAPATEAKSAVGEAIRKKYQRDPS